MYRNRNKLKDSRFTSKEFGKTKKSNDSFSPSSRAIVKRAENKLASIIRGKKTEYSNYNKSGKRSLVYPMCKRPKNSLPNKYLKVHKEKEKKKRFSPRITSTLRSNPDASVSLERTFSNSFSVLRQPNCSVVPHVEDTPVDTTSNKVFEKQTQEGTYDKPSSQEGTYDKPSSSGNRKSETPVIPYRNFADKIKKTLWEATNKLDSKTGFNLKSKISKILIETYNKSEKSTSNRSVSLITPPSENIGMSQLVPETANSSKSPKLNSLQLCKNTAVSSSSSSGVTPPFEVVSGINNAACPSVIFNPIKLLKKYEQILPNHSSSSSSSTTDANCLPRKIISIPHSPGNTKIFGSITPPKSVVVNPVSYMKQYDNMLSQNHKNKYNFSYRFDRNLVSNENSIPEFQQYGNLDHSDVFTGRTIFPTSSSTAVNSIFTENNYKPAESSRYVGRHASLPRYNEPEGILTYNQPGIPFFHTTNQYSLNNFGRETNSEREFVRQRRNLPENKYIYSIQDQGGNIQHINNWRVSAPIKMNPQQNSVFPLSRDADFEIEIPPDFELKIF